MEQKTYTIYLCLLKCPGLWFVCLFLGMTLAWNVCESKYTSYCIYNLASFCFRMVLVFPLYGQCVSNFEAGGLK